MNHGEKAKPKELRAGLGLELNLGKQRITWYPRA